MLITILAGIFDALHSIWAHRYFQTGMYRLLALRAWQGLADAFYILLISVALLTCLWIGFTLIRRRETLDRLGFPGAMAVVALILLLATDWLLEGRFYSLDAILRAGYVRAFNLLTGRYAWQDFTALGWTPLIAVLIVLIALLAIPFVSWGVGKVTSQCKLRAFLSSISIFVRRAAYVMVVALLAFGFANFHDRNMQLTGRPNVVWIVLDAVRADHLGRYGYEKPTSPFLDEFASNHALFRNAFSQESYTLPSVSSMFTSTYPVTHGVLYFEPTSDTLSPQFLTVAEILRNENYRTAAFVYNPSLSSVFNFDQGFDLYDDNREGFDYSLPHHLTYETAGRIFQKTQRYLSRDSGRPVFLYLHYRDPHGPYAPPPPYHEMFLPPGTRPEVDILTNRGIPFTKETAELYLSQYDGEIRYTDDFLRKTFRMLSAHGVSEENSVFVITADHGEEFFDERPHDPGGTNHGRTLYGEQIRVPLVISIPATASEPMEVCDNVELIDLTPTILDSVGVNWKKFTQFQGRSLLPMLNGRHAEPRLAFSGGNHGRVAIMAGEWKYYRYGSRSNEKGQGWRYRRPLSNDEPSFVEELYHLTEDPAETLNLVEVEEERTRALRKKAVDWITEFTSGHDSRKTNPGEDIKDRLKTLGYIRE